jgi:hypothetical protein
MIVRQNCTKSYPGFNLPEKREAAPFETASFLSDAIPEEILRRQAQNPGLIRP